MNTLELPGSVTSILVDTCFLVDSKEFPEVFGDFTRQIKERGVATYSIEFVKIEYIRSRTESEIKTKLEYFNKIVESVLPIERKLAEENLKLENKDHLIVNHLKSYGMDLDGVSLADLYLGMCLNQYKNLYLLTANHKDFSIYKREFVLPFETRRSVKSYALYKPS